MSPGASGRTARSVAANLEHANKFQEFAVGPRRPLAAASAPAHGLFYLGLVHACACNNEACAEERWRPAAGSARRKREQRRGGRERCGRAEPSPFPQAALRAGVEHRVQRVSHTGRLPRGARCACQASVAFADTNSPLPPPSEIWRTRAFFFYGFLLQSVTYYKAVS